MHTSISSRFGEILKETARPNVQDLRQPFLNIRILVFESSSGIRRASARKRWGGSWQVVGGSGGRHEGGQSVSYFHIIPLSALIGCGIEV